MVIIVAAMTTDAAVAAATADSPPIHVIEMRFGDFTYTNTYMCVKVEQRRTKKKTELRKENLRYLFELFENYFIRF
jgi:hypothetical protein